MSQVIDYIPEPNTGCHLFTGPVNSSGYGVLSIGRKVIYAHRLAYELEKGEISKGDCVCHTCDVRTCVNPRHLFLGSYGDNVRDCIKKKRHAHGVNQYNSRTTEEQVREIRAASGTSYSIAKRLGIPRARVHSIRTGRTWKHLL